MDGGGPAQTRPGQAGRQPQRGNMRQPCANKHMGAVPFVLRWVGGAFLMYFFFLSRPKQIELKTFFCRRMPGACQDHVSAIENIRFKDVTYYMYTLHIILYVLLCL